jgi:hypothetical protein
MVSHFGGQFMTKQILTVAISCDQQCPDIMPETCFKCKKNKKADIELIEILEDMRYPDDVPHNDEDQE